jgi:hypothetical protein
MCTCVVVYTITNRDILRSQAGLAEHHDNYHEFCRLLGRLKTNYQLSELVSNCRQALSALASINAHTHAQRFVMHCDAL